MTEWKKVRGMPLIESVASFANNLELLANMQLQEAQRRLEGLKAIHGMKTDDK